MADQITHPPRLSDLQQQIAHAQTQAKMDLLERTNEKLTSHLLSIFDGIGRNEHVELIYPGGEVVLITKARPRRAGEGAE